MRFEKGNKFGRGRNKATHTIQAAKAREFVVKKISKDLEPILQAQIDAAKGLHYEKKVGNETVNVYREVPDAKTGEYLINQVVGKPAESMQVMGKDGLPITIVVATEVAKKNNL